MATLYSPRIVTDGLVLHVDAANIKSLKHPIRDYEYGNWAAGQTGGIGIFGQYSVRNRRVNATDPFGNEAIVWEGYSVSGSTAGAGIYISPQSIDHTQTYRVSIWEKRINNQDATVGSYYFGCNGYGTVNGVRNLNSTSINTNPYFYSTTLPGVPTEWTLYVGHLRPSDTPTSGNSNFLDSGRYDINGNKIGGISQDFVSLPETTTFRLRTLSLYQPNATSEMIHHSIYPRIDLIDGTEPTLNDLITNGVEGIYDLSRNSNNLFRVNGPTFDINNNGSIVFDGVNDYIVKNSITGSFTDFTVNVWFNPSSVTDYENVLDLNYSYNGTTGNIGPRLEMSNSGLLRWIYSGNTSSNGSYYQHSVVSSGLQSNVWHCATIVYNGTSNTSITYYNGMDSGISRTTVGTPNGFVGSFNTLNIGRGFHLGGAERLFTGKVSNIQIYNRALSSTEIQTNYNAIKQRFGL